MDNLYYIVKKRAYELAQCAVEEQYKLQPAWSAYGSVGYTRAIEDSRYHMLMLASAYALNSPIMLKEYYEWLDILFSHLKLPGNSAFESIRTAAKIIDTKLRLNSTMQSFFASASKDSGKQLIKPSTDITVTAEAQTYYTYIKRNERLQAIRYISELYKKGMQVIDIYTTIFIPIQMLVGTLWHEGKITVAEEHYCTAVTQVALATLYQYFFSGEKKEKTLIATCISGELHELPIRFLADVFEMHDWTTHYYGASTPLSALIEEIEKHKPSLICISATMPFYVPEITEYITTIRAITATPIFIGGRPFSVDPELYKRVGADATAPNALVALELANTLV